MQLGPDAIVFLRVQFQSPLFGVVDENDLEGALLSPPDEVARFVPDERLDVVVGEGEMVVGTAPRAGGSKSRGPPPVSWLPPSWPGGLCGAAGRCGTSSDSGAARQC